MCTLPQRRSRSRDPWACRRALSRSGSPASTIFFVISGFIIAKAATGRTAAEFLTARLIRILPLYLVFASQQAIFAGLAGRPFGWREAIATFLFWPATDRMTSPALDVGWTLAFEMLFYAAAALVLTQRRGIVPLTYVAVGAWAVAFTLRPAGPVFQFWATRYSWSSWPVSSSPSCRDYAGPPQPWASAQSCSAPHCLWPP